MARKPLIRYWTQKDRVLLAKMLREGKSYGQIARHMKCSPSTVRNQARKLARSDGLAASEQLAAESESLY